MGLRPSDPEERKRRARRFEERQRQAARRYERKVKEEVLKGERDWYELPRVNSERRTRRMDEGEVYGPYHAWVKSHDCVGAGLPTHECRFFPSPDPTEDRSGIEGDHFRTVGAGGVDYRNDYPACPGWHDERHDDGVETIQRRHSIDLEAVCERLGDEWDALSDEEREAWAA